MKLTTFLIILSLAQVSASTLAQKITIKVKNASAITVLDQLSKKSNYLFVYDETVVRKIPRITLDLADLNIQEILDQTFKDTRINYIISGRYITLKEKEESLFEKAGQLIKSVLQDISVRGKVVDDDGAPLPGAKVFIKGTKNSTITDSNGNFQLKNVKENSTVVIEYVGYISQEIIAKYNLGTLSMKASSADLTEVEINAGYYSVKERELTGSISRITASTIEKQPVSNPLQALQNRMPGLEIMQLNGIPGAGFKVQIRGRNSIRTNGNNILYVVDGVVYPSTGVNTVNSEASNGGVSPLSFINPGDIESIEVLKDADATAIYGSRGANGVMLITTKKGAAGDLKINANFSQAFSRVGNKLHLMNTEQYLEMRREAFKNDGLTPQAADYDVNGTWSETKYTDWQDEIIGGTAKITNAAINFSGGSQKSNFLLGGNYYNEGTVFPGDFGFERGGIRANINFGEPKDRFKASFNLTYSKTLSENSLVSLINSVMHAPNAPDIYDEFGQLNWTYNGVRFGGNPIRNTFNTLKANTDNLIGNILLTYDIFNGLAFKTSLGYNLIKRDELAKTTNKSVDPATNPLTSRRVSLFGNSNSSSFLLEPQLVYNWASGPSKLSALVGMSFQKSNSTIRNINASNFSSDELMENIGSATVFSIRESSFISYKYASLFGRLNYSFSDKYLLNLTARRDGSTRFGPGNQFGNFGAIGAAWIFSDEGFVKSALPFLSFGKVRGSYGVTGNDQIGDYAYLQRYISGSGYQGTPTLSNAGIVNPYYGWETNKKAEVAIQFGVLNDNLNFEVAYYRSRSSNQLISELLPPSVGAESLVNNSPATVQNSGWEISARANILRVNEISWSANFNATVPKNKLISYPDLANSAVAYLFEIGKPLDIYKYNNVVLNPQTGLYVEEDRNGNGSIELEDRVLSKFLGQTLYGGLNNTITYGQFNLDFLFSFTKQYGKTLLANLLRQPGAGFSNGTGPVNLPVNFLDRWQKPGDRAEFLKYSTISGTNVFLAAIDGEQSISDNSFIRLKNISLSYNMSGKWLSKLDIKGLQINFSAQNVWTFTNFDGFDPESDRFGLPPLRTFSFGFNLTL